MFLHLFWLFEISKCFSYPKYSFLYTGSGYGEDVKDIKDYAKKEKYRICEEQSRYSIDNCLVVLEQFVEPYYCEGSKINKELSKIKTTTEILFVYAYDVTEVDFSNLKEQMIIFFENYGIYHDDSSKKLDGKLLLKQTINYMLGLSSDKSSNRLLNLAHSMKPKDTDDNLISIAGNIKDKVSGLFMLGYSIVKIIKDDLNVDTFYLNSGYFADESLKVKSTFFILDIYYNVPSDNIIREDIIQPSQFGVYDFASIYRKGYNITYLENDFMVSAIPKSSHDEKTSFNIPYKIAPIFNLITDFNYFVIQNSTKLESYNGINITVRNKIEMSPILYEVNKITIETKGWSEEEKNKGPKLILSIDEKIADFNPPEDFPLSFEKVPAYSYVPLNRKDKKNIGLIVGVTVACVVVVAIVIVVVVIIIKKNQANKGSEDEGAESHQSLPA